ncbi:hypothetical protein MYP_3691 [Sporocytophaga myxococcoides]|uniref:CBM-cenC domain-containing protein n=1 Tax=Sporocytophaga myxococcoides TaxID=153721 RepID=A0A098LJ98_9BACT|nr:carbohydrate binding domain-containing protein [Sporocytophaga myxococcoides]GAL86462.1 hypothetical protein MYP_3691 [Sporocytophaga myxococcoides]
MKRSVCIFICHVFIGISVVFSQETSENLLTNSSFENQTKGWNMWGGEIINEGRFGNYSLKVHLDSPRWSGADQTILISEGAATADISGWMKTENVVRGKESWEMARISVEFLDENGAMTGGYPPVTGQAEGTTKWTRYQQSYNIPSGAKKVKVQAVLGNCTGTAYFDDIQISLKGRSGEALQKENLSGPTDEGEWYELMPATSKAGHYADWSSLLDAPAGKHGFIKVQNGKLAFSDGTAARFWGVNLVAGSCFPEREVADSLAMRLSKMGCNLVRLHHMDAPWSVPNIFGNVGNSKQLSKESLNKLDYLIYVLKKKGIYIFLDLLVHRDFTEEDGVVNKLPDLGGKQVAYFDPKVIELQKEYIRQLLSHKNAYTKVLYSEEPAIIASEFINESSVFVHFGGDILTPHYRKELQGQFLSKGNQGKLSVFELDYSTNISPVLKEKEKGNTVASMRFLSSVEKDYYNEMYRLMRSMGVKYLLAGSNFPTPILAYSKDNQGMDLIITNDYWDHPQLWKINNNWNRILYAPVNNTSLLKNPDKGSIAAITKYKWYNKPTIVTEFNACYPNEFTLDALPYISAYGSLQGIDGIIQFDFDATPVGKDRITPFTLSKMPDHLSQWVVAAPIFLRNDVKTAQGIVIDAVNEKMIYELPSYSDFIDKNYHLPYITRVAKSDSAVKGNDPSEYTGFYDKTNKIFTSETKELVLNYQKGILKINSSRVQGVVGKLSEEAFDLPMIKVKMKNKWASVMLVSKDTLPLSVSENFYLIVTTPCKMKGQKFNETRTALEDAGNVPVLAQVADGEVIFKGLKNLKITPLGPDGEKMKQLPLTLSGEDSSLDLKKAKTFVFEIKVKRN